MNTNAGRPSRTTGSFVATSVSEWIFIVAQASLPASFPITAGTEARRYPQT